MDEKCLLEIRNLGVSFSRYGQTGCMREQDLKVISELSLTVHPGEIVAVAGSSGSGKSVLAHAVLGLLPGNAKVSGSIFYRGEELNKKKVKNVRGREISLIPQSVSWLDPLLPVGRQLQSADRKPGHEQRVRDCFDRLGLSMDMLKLYPFQLSGGMARRVLFSTAVLSGAQLILADEPTPGMHLSAAVEAMKILRELADAGKGILLITHDIDLALEVADRVAVFYAGSVLEVAKAEDFCGDGSRLRHPYTRALWQALPQNGFRAIPGVQPAAGGLPEGCLFGPRCSRCSSACEKKIPAMRPVREGSVSCVYAT